MAARSRLAEAATGTPSAQRQQGRDVASQLRRRKANGTVMNKIVQMPPQPQPPPILPLRSLKQLATKADSLAVRYEQIDTLLDPLGETLEATTDRKQIDKLIADAKRTAALDDRDQALL